MNGGDSGSCLRSNANDGCYFLLFFCYSSLLEEEVFEALPGLDDSFPFSKCTQILLRQSVH